MADESPRLPIYEIPYLRLFPWLRLFRAPGTAGDAKVLMVALIGVVLSAGGWQMIDRAFKPRLQPEFADGSTLRLETLTYRLVEPVRMLASPFLEAGDLAAPGADRLRAALRAAWGLLVWTLAGGAIARMAVVRLARSERVGLAEALAFAGRKAVPLVGTPLIPLLGVAILASGLAAFGLLYRIPGGATAAGALAFLPLIGGLLLTLVLIGLGAGWPLMQASVAVEAEDGFDAMSRSYAYVYQRPWHYAGCLVLAFLVGVVGLAFVDFFARSVVYLAALGLSTTGGAETIESLYNVGEMGDTSVLHSIHGAWLGLVAWLVRSWVYAYFWTAATIIYLILRREVDGTPWDDVAYQAPRNALLEAALAYRVPPPAETPPPAPAPHVAERAEAAESSEV